MIVALRVAAIAGVAAAVSTSDAPAAIAMPKYLLPATQLPWSL